MGQYYALLWPFMQSHLDVSVSRRGYCPNGVNSISMADTKTAAYNGGILVPHECLSGAKIGINSETSKLFGRKFSKGIKNKGTQALKPASLMY